MTEANATKMAAWDYASTCDDDDDEDPFFIYQLSKRDINELVAESIRMKRKVNVRDIIEAAEGKAGLQCVSACCLETLA